MFALDDFETAVMQVAADAGLTLVRRSVSAWDSRYLTLSSPDGGVWRASKKRAACFSRQTGIHYPRDGWLEVRIADHPCRQAPYHVHIHLGPYVPVSADERLRQIQNAISMMVDVHTEYVNARNANW